MESRLSAFTVMIRFITSSDVMCSDLWGKEARNNSAILRAWDALSQFRTMIVKILEVVEFIEPLDPSMQCARCVSHPSNQKRFERDPAKRAGRLDATPWFNRQGQAHIVSTAIRLPRSCKAGPEVEATPCFRTWFSIDPQPASIRGTDVSYTAFFIADHGRLN